MSEMIERVAASLMAFKISLPGAGGLRGDLHLTRAVALELATAAIAAMREPTVAMVQAVRSAKPYDLDLEESWPIAINEALR